MTMTRRELLGAVGMTAGSAAMYYAMASLGHAQESTYQGRISLTGEPTNGRRVLVLGAGLAGMTAALELRDAGYDVQVLEYREKAGGRCWTLRSGDTYTDIDGVIQNVDFEDGNYINPGPWRIPYNHHAVLDYCKRLGVKLEPFIQKNHNAYLHRSDAFGGEPQRFRHVATDYRGHVAELLAKATNQGMLDAEVTEADRETLINSLRTFGHLNDDNAYVESDRTSQYRGYAREAGGGRDGAPVPSEPMDFETLLQSELWRWLSEAETTSHQNAIFQPVGGMDMIAQAFAREVDDLVTYNARVISMIQNGDTVTVQYEDRENGGDPVEMTADWCVCTIPFSILGQMDHNLPSAKAQVVDTMYYEGAIKFGLEFNRRFWEEDDSIYGGITYTDLPISLISYPSNDYFSDGKGVLLGGYVWGANAYQFNAMQPDEAVRWAVEYGSRIHPQYPEEFSSGVCVSWHKVPWTLGCYGIWQDKERDYAGVVEMGPDDRIVLAGEHLSYLPAWMEGAILSSLDAIAQLHARATVSGAGE
ncbi:MULTISPECIES: flavin monoamine oxidase family protein [unclassified Yoonia]|uniref:flavin monoamine oxidase family protein n=1 Tax=unclassified Yoonia TaxID=2629118 RepID=UPI002AFF2C3B|nr:MULTISPECIES: flavin monoamine oxidase family protein [unclassified Yoonia]